MPKGNSDNNLRKARYARLRGMGVPRALAILVRDWSYQNYIEYCNKLGFLTNDTSIS